MAKNFFKALLLPGLFFLLFGLVPAVSADSVNCICSNGTKIVQADCGACTAGCGTATVTACQPTGSTCPTGAVCLDNPLAASGVNTPQQLIGRVINSVLGVVGSLALLMFIYGGLTWMTSGGSPEKVKKGREIITWSAIGLFIIFASYALVRFLISSL